MRRVYFVAVNIHDAIGKLHHHLTTKYNVQDLFHFHWYKAKPVLRTNDQCNFPVMWYDMLTIRVKIEVFLVVKVYTTDWLACVHYFLVTDTINRHLEL